MYIIFEYKHSVSNLVSVGYLDLNINFRQKDRLRFWKRSFAVSAEIFRHQLRTLNM